jgi:tRNA dimethylallyltransferase
MSGPLLVVVLGPTASGKTALSMHLAERFRGEIVNCDSVAVYREFEIGTAKPSPEERGRVPHHLINVAGPLELLTAGDYSRLARQAIQEISSRGRLPVVAGGTGLYLRALLDGLFIGLNPEREALYARINARAREMFSAGLVEETRALAGRYGTAARPLAALGYKQAMQYLRGELSLEEAITTAQQGHRNYAKRQMTWFRREPHVHWINGFGSDAQVQDEAGRQVTG